MKTKQSKHLFFNETTENEPATEALERTRPPREFVRPRLVSSDQAEAEAEAGGGAEGEPRRCTGAGGGFGVSVDLSRFFADERARCAVWVPHGAARAGWLAARLSARLGLGPPARLALLSSAHPAGLLHPHDPLLLLRPHCSLSVVPVDVNPFKDVYETDSNGKKLQDNQLNEKEVFDTDMGLQATAYACERTGAESGATAAAAAGPAPAPASAPASAPRDHGGRADDALREMKQAALSLLDSLSADGEREREGRGERGGEEEGPARARRRRVRRRRRPGPQGGAGADLTDAPDHKVPKAAAARSDSAEPEDDSGDVQGSSWSGGGGGESAVEPCPAAVPARRAPSPPAPAPAQPVVLRRAPSTPAPEPRLVRALDTSAASLWPIYATSN